jgi:GT2 family glycosyltransferase
MSLFKPWQVLHLELSQGLPELPVNSDYQGLYLVLFWFGIPLGELELQMAHLPMPATQLTHLVLQTITPAVGCYLLETGFQAALPVIWKWSAPTKPTAWADLLGLQQPLKRLQAQAERLPGASCVSVVVCTRDRPDALQSCLRSLQQLDPPPLEILVVDNAPSSDATYQLVSQLPTVRYIREPEAGLSAARNTGIRASKGTIIAFTDDDVTVHPTWTARLQQAFFDPQVMAVTGLVLPTQLATESQLIFEQGLGGFSQGYRHKVFDPQFFATMKALGVPVWKMGAGANMAFRRQAFEQVGDFDQRLGAGRSGCSEDSELWYRLLAEGWCCRYEPQAVVYHSHRSTLASLQHQMYQYMRGHVAALLIQFERYQHWGNVRRLLIALPRYYCGRALGWLLKRHQPPAQILVAEIMGCFAGLSFYWQHRQAPSQGSQTSFVNLNDPGQSPVSVEGFGPISNKLNS